jgi:proteasome lid subunit RPN8/RPN11
MEWKNVESDIKIEKLSDLFESLGCLSVVRITANLIHGFRIYALRSCIDAVWSHVSSDNKEVGGLLVGQVWRPANSKVFPFPLITILYAIPSVEYRNTSVSLEMGSNVWNHANNQVSAENLVVGWYHSHPNLGAFFSGTDRRTQGAFFYHDYSLGWVIDPFRKEQKVFVGRESEEYSQQVLELDQQLVIN